MKHARDDYNRIQDPAGLIPVDEPVFLVRGQDTHGPAVLEFWASLVLKEAPTSGKPIAEKALAQAQAMRDWQAENGRKSPDLPDAWNA